MYSIGVIQDDEVSGHEPMQTESAAIVLAYDRSLESDKCFTVSIGAGGDQKVLYVIWRGNAFKRHELISK